MQLGKILAAGAMGALMAGASIAVAASDLKDYPAPFVKDSTVDTLVVVGKTAATDDVVGAIDLAARLGGESTTSYTCKGTTAGVSVTGEGKEIETTNTKIYLGDPLRKTGARTTFTSTEMPTTLKSGVLQDSDASDSYKYDQYIDLTTQYNVTYAQHVPSSAVTEDPALLIRHTTGTSPSIPTIDNALYKSRVIFQKNVNCTTAVGEKITIFGSTYTIASTTTCTASPPKLVLFGSSETRVFTEKETVTVTIGGTAYDVTLKGVESSTGAVVQVGTESKSVSEGSTYTISGLNVYVEDVFYYGSTRTDNQAKLGLGAETITFEDEKRVTRGSGGSETNIDGTTANLTTSSGKLSTLEVYVVPEKTNVDVMKIGGEFKDPVFKTFNIKFPSATPGLTDSARSTLEVKNSGDDSLTFTWTDFKGYTKTLTWAYDADSIDLEDSAAYKYKVVEGERIYQNEYIVVDAGDFPHLLRVTDLDNDGSTNSVNDVIEFTDMFSGSTYKFTLGLDNYTTAYIDGQAYYIDGGSTASGVSTSTGGYSNYVIITWGDGATYNNAGSELTVYPKLRGKNGEYVALTNQTRIALNTALFNASTGTKYLDLPTGRVQVILFNIADSWYLNMSAYTGYSVSFTNAWNLSVGDTRLLLLGKTTTGRFNYNLTGVGGATGVIAIQPSGDTAATKISGTIADEGLILVEEQDKDGNVFSVYVPAGNKTVAVTQIISGAPSFTHAGVKSAAFKSDTYKTGYVDLYGVYAERNTYGQDSVKIYYPDDQMKADLFILGPDGAVTTTAAVAGETVKKAVPIKTALAKLDTEIADVDKTTKNLILVGGPCVNTLVASLATPTGTATAGKFDYTCENWPGENFALIKVIDDAFASGKAALVVAGTRAQDTRDATTALQQFDVSPYSGKLTGTKVKIVGATVTPA